MAEKKPTGGKAMDALMGKLIHVTKPELDRELAKWRTRKRHKKILTLYAKAKTNAAIDKIALLASKYTFLRRQQEQQQVACREARSRVASK